MVVKARSCCSSEGLLEVDACDPATDCTEAPRLAAPCSLVLQPLQAGRCWCAVTLQACSADRRAAASADMWAHCICLSVSRETPGER